MIPENNFKVINVIMRCKGKNGSSSLFESGLVKRIIKSATMGVMTNVEIAV